LIEQEELVVEFEGANIKLTGNRGMKELNEEVGISETCSGRERVTKKDEKNNDEL